MSRTDQYLMHVTLTSDNWQTPLRRSYRDEIRDHSVAGAQDLIRRALQERVPMHAFGPEVAITATAEGRSAMIATIWDGQAPVVTLGCARTNRAGAGLWRILLRTPTPQLTPVVLDESSRPPAPWVAARIEVGAARVPRDIMTAIRGIEAVIGWGFLDMGLVDLYGGDPARGFAGGYVS